ncbi:MAG: beta-propeller domain-containing protein [Candidatus Thermoplasmatota archaeon]
MRKILLVAVYLLVASLVLTSGCLDFARHELGDNTNLVATPLKKFSSYEELKNFVKAGREVVNTSWYYTNEIVLTADAGGDLLRGYSTTNVQVEGVDEADIVKTDGEYIYVVSGKSVIILRAYPAEEAQILSQLNFSGTINGIFVNGDKLVVFEQEWSYYCCCGACIEYRPWKNITSFIKVYNISDRQTPVLVRNISVDGYYFNSRMVENYVYVIIERYAQLENDEIILPKISFGEDFKIIPATEIYYCNISDYSYTFTIILAINIRDDSQEPTQLTVLLGSSASSMYVSLHNIYIAVIPVYGWLYSAQFNEKTSLYRIYLRGAELQLVASGEVPGRILNQFSMDEYNGYFRIATTTGWWNGGANVYVLDLNLRAVGELNQLAPGENFHSARFVGDRCYLVTFKKVDPFFVIDLINPAEPKVLGELKITGYSDYLHPYDENHIIGIGKETVDMGSFAWYQGVKISLFDVTDVGNPKELAKYVIGDRGTESPVLGDHKALLMDRARNLLVIPVLVAEVNESQYPEGAPPNAYGEYVWQGVYVFNLSLEGLVLKGGITHLENNITPWHYSPYSVKRSLYIGNVLYTISDKKIKMNSLENLEEINELELPYSGDYMWYRY